MSINQLIARGGTGIKSPVQRYLETKEQMGREDQNRLVMASNRQGMDIQRQQMQIAQEKQAMARRDDERKFMAGTLRTILDQPEAERPALYENAKELWQKQGISPDKFAPDYDDPKAQQFTTTVLGERKGQFKQMVDPAGNLQQGMIRDGRVYDRSGVPQPDWSSAPTKAETAGAGGFAPTKKVASKIQESLLSGEQFLDDVSSLGDVLDSMPDMSQTWVADATDATLTAMSRTFGTKYDGDIQKFRADKQNVRTFTRKISDSYRKMITGQQANKYELKRIAGQMPNEKDDWGTIKEKMKTLSSIVETSNVRARMAMEQGFKYAGRKNGELIYTKDGKTHSIDKIPSLGNIKTHEDMRQQIAESIKLNNPELDNKSIRDMAKSQMSAMGYNMRRYR